MTPASLQRTRPPHWMFLLASIASLARPVAAQTVAQRGFVEARAVLFPQTAPNDGQRLVGDLLAREEVFLKPRSWIQFAAGLDARANSHDQVERRWRVDLRDRGALRPALSLRRATATLTHGPVTVDLGKQFIRWGRADIVTPTDRFAPRDFIDVIDNELLGVTGARGVGQIGSTTLELVWVPFLTPSRTPLLDQRWTVVPPAAAAFTLVDRGSSVPQGSETGVRWGRSGTGVEYSLSYFDGFNHLPDIDVLPGPSPLELTLGRTYPAIKSYGADLAMPTRWMTIKGETAYVTSPNPASDEYVTYVIQLERQTGEWSIVGGYAGEVVTTRRALLPFSPDRGLTRAIVARTSYTIGPTSSVAVETAVRQNGHGAYVKGEYSRAYGQHWRAITTGAAIGGRDDDFLGQYKRNSHVTISLRYSF